MAGGGQRGEEGMGVDFAHQTNIIPKSHIWEGSILGFRRNFKKTSAPQQNSERQGF